MRLPVGEVPTRPLLLTTTDRGRVLDLNQYDTVAVELFDPDGEQVDTSGGSASITTAGALQYTWPATSLFPTVGRYRVAVRAQKGQTVDWSVLGTIEVYRPGGGA